MITDTHIHHLGKAASDAIETALVHGAHVMRNPPRTEVGLVAAVTLGAVPDLASRWQSILQPVGFTVQLTGVFCHGAPIVEYKSTPKPVGCELADLLIVVESRINGITTRRASLIQAKMACAAGSVSFNGVSSKKQLHLFTAWPAFRFKDATYGTKSFQLVGAHGGTDHGTVGVIDRHWRSSNPLWTQHLSAPLPVKTAGAPTLGVFLAQMVKQSHGHGVVVKLHAATDWDELIEKLLSVTYSRVFSHTRTLGAYQPPRGVTAFALLGSSQAITLYEAADSRQPTGGTEGSFDLQEYTKSLGVSTLHCIISQE